jgi:hypothetical protein
VVTWLSFIRIIKISESAQIHVGSQKRFEEGAHTAIHQIIAQGQPRLDPALCCCFSAEYDTEIPELIGASKVMCATNHNKWLVILEESYLESLKSRLGDSGEANRIEEEHLRVSSTERETTR